MSSASRGLAPHEVLALSLLKMGRTRPLLEPPRGLQVGKSGYPGSQNTDNIPWAQCTLTLGFEVKPKGKCEAPRVRIACGLS